MVFGLSYTDFCFHIYFLTVRECKKNGELKNGAGEEQTNCWISCGE